MLFRQKKGAGGIATVDCSTTGQWASKKNIHHICRKTTVEGKSKQELGREPFSLPSIPITHEIYRDQSRYILAYICLGVRFVLSLEVIITVDSIDYNPVDLYRI